MRGTRINNIIDHLAEHFAPFAELAKERLRELGDASRILEMQQGEIFQLKADAGGDYLFLIRGHLDVVIEDSEISLVNSEYSKSRPFVIPSSNQSISLHATDDVVVCHVNREMVDRLLSWSEVTQLYEDEGNEKMFRCLSKLKNCQVLRSLPVEKVEMAFKRMREISVKKGEEIVRAGEPGHTFYIITSGTAELWRRSLYDTELQFVGTLTEGSSFGNGALITGNSSDRTVRMIEDGTLMALDKPDFDEIIGKQLIKRVNANVARSMLDSGYALLDVRYEEEFDESYIPGATLVPLHDLAKRVDELDKNTKYVVYCHSGSRSAVAVMRLSQHHIEAWSLEGGIRDWPYTTSEPFGRQMERRTGPKCRRQSDRLAS